MRAAGAVALAALALTLAGCAAAPAAGDAAAGRGEPVVVRVNDPGNQGPLAVAKKTGELAEAFAEVGAELEWVDGEYAFTANVPLFNAGQLDVANAAFAPIAGATAKGLPVKIVSVQRREVLTENAGIVAAPGSGIETIEDLVGRRVAVNAGGKGEYLLLDALEQVGIPFDAVERVALQPSDGVAAFASGQIDAWSTFSDYFAQAARTGTVLATERSLDAVDDNVYAFRSELIDAHPEIGVAFVETLQELLDRQHEDPEAFLNVFEKTGPTALVGDAYDNELRELQGRYEVHVPGPADAERLQRVLDLFRRAGVIQTDLDPWDLLADLDG
ncbi:ABC transporter substrate-binding protein [Microbacterium sp. MEC084]|uniref:ABC transporter substrate-binding protein n=1 Tax=Microbacterium sp. MEC084 TaxID=1963027 RepID=UPI00106F44F7|nr:NrtA/SsuA/CpmA family ABC transporter substrate-binding protein [Microbacterium sp. MEC084]MCD1269729.1 ABC transporter substrate-binding protein [Microbacterium sp. MEC084]